MFKYLLAVLVVIYIYTLIQCFFQIKNIDFLIDIIEKYLKSVEVTSNGNLIFHDEYNTALSNLLNHYPEIVNYLGFYTPTLKYGALARETHRNVVRIYNDILMERNYSVSRFLKSFNPIKSLKKLLKIPSTFLNWIGFNLKSDSTKFINLIGWLLAYFLNLYADEIKLLIASFFEK